MGMIKDLRERTGAPVTDVKKALEAAGWDIGEALACRSPKRWNVINIKERPSWGNLTIERRRLE